MRNSFQKEATRTNGAWENNQNKRKENVKSANKLYSAKTTKKEPEEWSQNTNFRWTISHFFSWNKYFKVVSVCRTMRGTKESVEQMSIRFGNVQWNWCDNKKSIHFSSPKLTKAISSNQSLTSFAVKCEPFHGVHFLWINDDDTMSAVTTQMHLPFKHFSFANCFVLFWSSFVGIDVFFFAVDEMRNPNDVKRENTTLLLWYRLDALLLPLVA